MLQVGDMQLRGMKERQHMGVADHCGVEVEPDWRTGHKGGVQCMRWRGGCHLLDWYWEL